MFYFKKYEISSFRIWTAIFLIVVFDVYFEKLGIIGGDKIEIKNVGKKSVAALRDNFELGVGAIMFHEEE